MQIEEIAFFLAGLAAALVLALLKANLRCRHCANHQREFGAVSGILAQTRENNAQMLAEKDKAILFMQETLDRALVAAGIPNLKKTPEQIQAEKEEREEAERQQKVIKEGGEIFGE